MQRTFDRARSRCPRVVGLVASALFASGCFVFDASLYMDRDAGQPDAGMPSISGELSETCADRPPQLFVPPGASLTFQVETLGRSDDNRETTACTGAIHNGPDLFLEIDPEEGDRWHFHVRVD